MKIQKAIKNAALTTVCLILVIPIVVYTFPFILGANGSYTVMSGSMSPALRPGDLIIVNEREPVNIGDMVTVESDEFTYTHRVVEMMDDGRFRLKGDANEDPDLGLVEASQIIGKVVLIFPFGHLYTPYVFAVALLVPAALIIGKQVHTVYQFTKRRNKRETMSWRRKSHSALDTGTLILALILTVSTTRVIAPHFIAGSSSYFSDVERGTGFFCAGIWEVGVEIEIEPDIKPNVLNLGSKGKWVMVYIQSEYDANKIDVSTVRLESVLADGDEWKIEDGRLMVKFDRESVISNMEVSGEYVTLTVSGLFVDGVRFTGEDTIKVVNHEG